MKTQKTCAQVQNFNNVATAYLARIAFLSGEGSVVETKLCHPLKRLQKTEVKKVFDAFNEELTDIRRNNAAVDPVTQVILRESNGLSYAYTKEGEKLRDQQLKALSEKLYEIEPIIIEHATGINLTQEENTAFAGFVIPEPEQEEG